MRGASSKFYRLTKIEGVADFRWGILWEIVGDNRDAKARLAAKGFQGPDLKAGLAEAWARVSLRSSRPHVASTSALTEWKLRSLDIRDAPSQAGSFDREACPRVPLQWDQQRPRRVWRFRAPVSELNRPPGT